MSKIDLHFTTTDCKYSIHKDRGEVHCRCGTYASVPVISIEITNLEDHTKFTKEFCVRCIQGILWNPLSCNVSLELPGSRAHFIYNNVGRRSTTTENCFICGSTTRYTIDHVDATIFICDSCLRKMLRDAGADTDNQCVIDVIAWDMEDSMLLKCQDLPTTFILPIKSLLYVEAEKLPSSWKLHASSLRMCSLCLTESRNTYIYQESIHLCKNCISELATYATLLVSKRGDPFLRLLKSLRREEVRR